jgi:hypothetical protein
VCTDLRDRLISVISLHNPMQFVHRIVSVG